VYFAPNKEFIDEFMLSKCAGVGAYLPLLGTDLVRTWYGLDTDSVSLDLIIIPLLREIFFDASGVIFFARFWIAF